MSLDVERFTGGGAVGVDLAAIERDLAALWRQAASGNSAVMRACSWNLVVQAENEAALTRAKVLADALVAVVPSRTLVLHHRPSAAGPEIEAFVSANCQLMPGGGKLLCSEEITVESRRGGVDYLPSLTRALLVPDIPTAVLFAGLPELSALFRELLVSGQRLILDSRGGDLAALSSFGAALPRVVDLAWLRSAPWRLAMAAAFDPPVDPSMLFRLDRVKVSCDEASATEARLLIGWLAARLSWGPKEDDGRVLRQQGHVRVELEWTTRPGLRVELLAEGGRKRVAESGAPPLEDRALIVAALGPRGVDRLYQSALRRAVELTA